MNTRAPLMPVLSLLALFIAAPPAARAQMKAHFINVGQAESILLEFNTAAVLIDAGGEDTSDQDDRRSDLLRYLDHFFKKRPDLREKSGKKRGVIHSLVVSHPHPDHTKHLTAVMERYWVRNLVDNGGKTGSGIDDLIAARELAEKQKAIYNRIDDSKIGKNGYRTSWLEALAKDASKADLVFLAGGRGCENENNDSVVLLVSHAGSKFLFVGDAESERDKLCGDSEIQSLLDFYGAGSLLDVDLYKVGHHGSHNGTTRGFLREMTPKISLISAGDTDTREPGGFHAFQHGHPRQEAVDSIVELTSGSRASKTVTIMDKSGNFGGKPVKMKMTKAVYCTCWDGDVVVSVAAGGQMTVSTSK